MYSSKTGLILGFHGTDQSVVDEVLRGHSELKPSNNTYDWLGNGIYFWDNNPLRALEWARMLSERPESKIRKPAVIGAIIDLDNCLDFLDQKYISMLAMGYSKLSNLLESSNLDIPTNRGGVDRLLRELDCAVIETIHHTQVEMGDAPFSSVRGVFSEGKEVYPGAGFREKDHIQICVRDVSCIKGYFLPLNRVTH